MHTSSTTHLHFHPILQTQLPWVVIFSFTISTTYNVNNNHVCTQMAINYTVSYKQIMTQTQNPFHNHPTFSGHICNQHTNPYTHLTRVPRSTILPLIKKHSNNLYTHKTRVHKCTHWGLQHRNSNPLQTTVPSQHQSTKQIITKPNYHINTKTNPHFQFHYDYEPNASIFPNHPTLCPTQILLT